MNCKIKSNDDLYAYYLTGGTSDDPASASTVLGGGLEDLTRCSILPDSGIIEQPNKNYDIKYEVDEYGNVKLSAVDKAGNPIDIPESEQRILDSLQSGINDALKWLGTQKNARGEAFKFNDLNASVGVIMNFISRHAEAFFRITGGETSENAYELAYNATVGLAIANFLTREPWSEDPYGPPASDKHGSLFNRYQHEIGFWSSFYNRAMNLKMQLYTPDSNHPGLIDLGNLIKAIIMDESRFSQWEDPMADEKDKKPKGHDFEGGGYTRWGLMAVGIHETSTIKATANEILIRVFPGATGFTIGDIMYDPFLNIGAGVGHFMCALTPNWRTSPLNHTPTWKELKDAVLNYNGGTGYKNRVWERFQKYRESSNKIINP